MTIKKMLCLYFVITIIGFVGGCSQKKLDVTLEQTTVDENLLLTLPSKPISYFNHVKPVLERRCVSCHGCFDAPCQLKLTSIEGIQRGASKEKVYDGSRIFGINPTRLMIDAKTTAQWRDKNFHTVLNEGENTPRKNLEDSILYQLLRLKQIHPQARTGMLSNDFDLSLDREQSCPKPDEFQHYAQEHPKGGMPYAMPNLSNQEYKTLVQWIAQGSPVDSAPAPTKHTMEQVAQWEQFFNNRSSNKEILVNRYLYEHLFQAHIHFKNAPPREFFRLVRSTTPPSQKIDELASVRPYDDPGTAPFYYRLRPHHASIVAKEHVVYELSPQKMVRYQELFLDPDYSVEHLPSYDPKTSANPFKVYKDIPPNMRYRFLLDNARFFIEGFIKGPVCRGQVALNVIEDQFWVFFFNPDYYLNTSEADFLKDFSSSLAMPSEKGNTLNIISAWTEYIGKLDAYWKAKEDDFLNQSQQSHLEQAMQSIWDGNGTNPNAALTIYRHFDSASVHFGLTGDYPETAWIIDYPLLERIHYLLVAGFNVYGNVGHQLNTRLYMDFLRMEGEDNFLAYLPISQRKTIRDSWYVGMREILEKETYDSKKWLDKELVIGYQTDDPQAELYQQLEQHLGAMAGPEDPLNRCQSQSCQSTKYTEPSAEQRADAALTKIANINGAILQVFPDLAFIRIKTDPPQTHFVYTLIRNKSHKTVSSMISSEADDQRDVENDTLTVMKGLQGSYPNFFFDVPLQHVNDFAERYAAIRNRADYEQFVELFGVRRTNTDFWAIADWFQNYDTEQHPVRSGLFDLSRYNNR
ncbi:Fatty acid cis/trans isomerase [hydrothermal vent metagenome]|uniref:Fatty acid cis/trans isomerase n=1 Tax=hydrothermal vent metagenome TaxID=652676 RepID=A0A3B0W2B5_9ZZZZ